MKMTDDPEMHQALAEVGYAPLPEYVASKPATSIKTKWFDSQEDLDAAHDLMDRLQGHA